MTTEQKYTVGQIVYQGWGEYSSNRPADIDAEPRETKAEALEDAQGWYGWLTEREQSTASYGVTKCRVIDIDEDGTPSMSSC